MTYVLFQLHKFWKKFKTKLVSKWPCIFKINKMHLQLTELLAGNEQVKEVRVEMKKG